MSPERVVLSQEKLADAMGDRWSEAELSEAVALLSKSDGRFPAGVRTLPPDLVQAVQRERLIVSMLAAAAERGYRALTVQDVLTRAGISRPTFYEQFQDKEDCFLAAFDAAAGELQRRVRAAAEKVDANWRDRMRAGLEELLRYIDEEPKAARTVLVEARASSPPSAIAAAGVVGGIESVLYARLQKGDTEDLDSLVPSLMYFAVLTYAGHDAAGDELDGAALA
jgi:AcrR family transcriptional regulator